MSHDTNRGDYAILAATYKALLQYDPSALITVVSVELGDVGLDDPTQTGRTTALGCAVIGTPAPPRASFSGPHWRWLARLAWCEIVLGLARVGGTRMFALMPRDTAEFFDTLREADVTVTKGGAYIHALGGARELLYLWRMLYPIRVAKLLCPRVVLLGVSLGEFRSSGAQTLARMVLRQGVDLYVREPRSAEVAKRQLGLPSERIRSIPDLAFLTDTGTGVGVCASGDCHTRIGVTVRLHKYPQCDFAKGRANYVNAMTYALQRVLEADQTLRIVFIPQVDADAVLARELAAAISRPEQVQVLEGNFDIEQLLQVYASLDILVGARLHSVILAAVAGVPSVHVVYEPAKSYGTLELLGLEGYGIRYEDLDADALTALIEGCMENRSSLSPMVARKVAALKTDIDQTLAAALL